MTTKNTYLEMVEFSLKDGVSAQDLREGALAAQRFVEEQPGYLSRHLAQPESADGRWVDLVLWASEDDAKAAQARAMASEDCALLFSQIDESSMSMRHLHARSFGAMNGV